MPNVGHEALLPLPTQLPESRAVWGTGAVTDQWRGNLVNMMHHSAQLAAHLKQGTQNEASVLQMGGSLDDTPALRDILFYLASSKQSQLVCEFGFQTGHSSLLWLSASNQTEVISFEVDKAVPLPITNMAVNFLQKDHPGRLKVLLGSRADGMRNLATYLRSFVPERKCDIVFLSGGREYDDADTPFQDLVNLRSVSDKQTLVLMADLYCTEAHRCTTPTTAWHKALRNKLLREFDCFVNQKVVQGFCTGQYLFE